MKKENICFHSHPLPHPKPASSSSGELSTTLFEAKSGHRGGWGWGQPKNLVCIQKPPVTHGLLNKHSEVQACVPANAHFLPSPEWPSNRWTANTTVHNLQAPPERRRSRNSHRLGPQRQGRLTFFDAEGGPTELAPVTVLVQMCFSSCITAGSQRNGTRPLGF